VTSTQLAQLLAEVRVVALHQLTQEREKGNTKQHALEVKKRDQFAQLLGSSAGIAPLHELTLVAAQEREHALVVGSE
jgi:hypothetical protein